jgi:hypothetical protein
VSAMAKLARSLKLSLAAGSIVAIALGLLRATEPDHTRDTAAPAAASAAPRCRFTPGETAAFTLESTVRDVRGDEEDHFRATLSWQVADRLADDRWRLRAAFSDVSHSQALTLPEERAEGPLTDPFFVDVDASCRFVGFGFARDWDPRRRQLVRSMLLTHEFVLPPATAKRRWSASQSDALGAFEASYAIASAARGPSVRIKRRKTAYEGQTAAAAMGLSVVLVGSEATASVDRERPHWLTSSSGLERVQILVHGEVEADLLQQFRLTRDDARFIAVRALADADFRDAFGLADERDRPVDPRVAQMSYEEALQAFLARFGGADQPSYAAARSLAAWLRAHPEAAHRLIAAVRADAVDEAARPALFLALELSGTESARDALSDALADPRLRALDRARAASALSDIGEPTRNTAELLLAHAQNEGDDMVANVSLLGLGNMSRRSGDDELRTYVRASLEKELATAGDAQALVVLDAMGNTGDPALADALASHIDAESAATRQHAAEALGRLDPAATGPRLLDRLREETDPAVGAAIVRAMNGPPTADAIELMSDRLAASTSLAERSAIIAWLGAASRTRPEARGLLAAHVRGETNARLVQQIGAFVPASELR